jgi:hypothetical protein
LTSHHHVHSLPPLYMSTEDDTTRRRCLPPRPLQPREGNYVEGNKSAVNK